MDDKPRSIVISNQILKTLNFFIDFPFLEQRKVSGKIVTLDKSPLNVSPDIIVYIIPSNVFCLDQIFFQIQNHRSNGMLKKYYIIFIPKITYECQAYIDMKEINKTDIELCNLPIDVFPLDYDILSLENHSYDYTKPDTNLPDLNKVILKIETIFGKIKHKYGKGNSACELIKMSNKEEKVFDSENEILASFFIDRQSDIITPMASVNTYEGLIDEHIGISLNTLKRTTGLIENDKDKILNSKNEFYEKIRDLNFGYVRNFLPQKLESLRNIMKEAMESTETDMKALSEGLEKIKQAQEFQPCKVHINIASEIRIFIDQPIVTEILMKEQPMLAGQFPDYLYDFYENNLIQQKNFHDVIKLMILESQIFAGVKAKSYDSLKRDMLNVRFNVY